MCGILFHAQGTALNPLQLTLTESPNVASLPPQLRPLLPLMEARGPDATALLHDGSFYAVSSVLSLRSPFTAQPLKTPHHLIQFNGELYNADIKGNDTAFFAEMIEAHGVSNAIAQLEGEFSYAVVDFEKQTVYFGRDRIGKRSLVYSVENDMITVASLAGKEQKFVDCTGGVLYTFNFSTSVLSTISLWPPFDITSNTDTNESNISRHITTLGEQLRTAVRNRIGTIEPLHPSSAPFAVLFSGGLDCTLIAAIAAQLSPHGTTIDLITVAFDNPRTGLPASAAPDRTLACSSAKGLQTRYPYVLFNLIEVDVAYDEYLAAKDTVTQLMFPKCTEMDLSIAMAFYFASKPATATSPRVLLSGLGADELFGGYHKLANKQPDELVQELSKQIANIHDRNLSRDDKVMSANGIEVRYPFLCENVVTCAVAMEINYKIDKMILRRLAREEGLEFVESERKRAIQFGARSAKMEAGRAKGTDIIG